MSIAHVCSGQNIVTKTIYHAVNVTSAETELFVIRCRINQVIQVTDILCIIVVTNAIHSVRCIFNSLSHHYQIQFITIAQDLRFFFEKSIHNFIKFWDCPSNAK